MLRQQARVLCHPRLELDVVASSAVRQVDAEQDVIATMTAVARDAA